MKGKTNDLTINCVCHSIRSMFRVLGIYNFALLLAVKTKKRKKNKPNQNTLQRFRAKLFQTLKVIFECLKLETAILICNWYTILEWILQCAYSAILYSRMFSCMDFKDTIIFLILWFSFHLLNTKPLKPNVSQENRVLCYVLILRILNCFALEHS